LKVEFQLRIWVSQYTAEGGVLAAKNNCVKLEFVLWYLLFWDFHISTGAKFGGYGSFLPTYQRSPVWSHPRTSPKIQHFNASRSPNHLQLEVDIYFHYWAYH
jgi:hypothetical protein